MLRRLGLLAPLALLLVAAPAPAATSGSLVAGPYLVAGNGIAWLDGDESDWVVHTERGGSVAVAASGRLRSDISDDESGDVDTESVGAFAAAGEAIVVETRRRSGNAKYSQYNDSSDVRLYPSQGSPRGLSACTVHLDLFGGGGPGPGTPASPRAEIATDGAHVAVSLCGQTKVFDLAGGAAIDQPAGGVAVAIAGGFLALQDGSGVTVRNWQTGVDAYRVPFPTGTRRGAVDLQDDGALALVSFATQEPDCVTGVLTWHTPATPAGAVLPVAPCTADVAAAGGRAVIVAAAAGTGRALAEVSAADGTRRDIAWLGSGSARSGGLDYAAGVAAYAMGRCGGRVELLRSTGDATPRAVECPRLVLKSAKRRGRTLRVRASIAPAATAPVALTYRVAGRTVRRSLRPRGGAISVDVQLPARARGRRGKLTLTFPGDATYERQVVRG